MQLFSLHSPVHVEIVIPKKKSRFERGFVRFQLGFGSWFLDQGPQQHFLQAPVHLLCHYLSEKIGYCRYITAYRDLKTNPEYPCYPSWHQFSKYFETWCQDENRDGDFFSALLKAQPQFLNNWQAKLWSRLYCLSALQRFCIDNITVSTRFCPCHPKSI